MIGWHILSEFSTLIFKKHFSYLRNSMFGYAQLFINLFRKVFPKGLSLRKGLLGSTMRAFPGIIPSMSPCMMAVKQSVVGSGPTRLPGTSCSRRYLQKEINRFPLHARFLSNLFLERANTALLFLSSSNYEQLVFLLDKSSLSCRVLTNHEHHGFVVKVSILQTWGVEVMKTIILLNRKKLLTIQRLQPLCNRPDHFRSLFDVFPPPARHNVETVGFYSDFASLT